MPQRTLPRSTPPAPCMGDSNKSDWQEVQPAQVTPRTKEMVAELAKWHASKEAGNHARYTAEDRAMREAGELPPLPGPAAEAQGPK